MFTKVPLQRVCVGSCRTTSWSICICHSDDTNPRTNRRDKVVDNGDHETYLSATMTGSLASRALQRPRSLGSLICKRNQQSRRPNNVLDEDEGANVFLRTTKIPPSSWPHAGFGMACRWWKHHNQAAFGGGCYLLSVEATT